ncbi:hypothetical protein I317_04735 [Kwoniella heveanensis CBS 569]|uniref:Uncharacterized protein n=1 Tax=Kwoniella heveanensis BCC8398 TaxID=1296120 RepID=A0A1B9GZP2_9TREE|nr:hypothetical protein I316_01728 [Kwoniella heveanensis BCC8398]OCF41434.1 hypothetical protein I317_04735 [Kwoniella heveanensis CBS 569]
MFKKRSRPASVRDKKPEDAVPLSGGDQDNVASGSGSGSNGNHVGEGENGAAAGSAADEGDETGRTIEELVMLRKLRKMQAHQGIDLERLNRGEEKKGKGKKKELDASEKYGLQAGTGSGRAGEDKDEDENDKDRAKRLVRTNNFTQQTNALDVDKHMMAYIEAELAKKRGEATPDESDSKVKEVYDPQAELYKIAEKYKLEAKKAKVDEEGSVSNSLGMLTSIPEVDLGMDNRLKNIEMTERAKREMIEQRKQAALEASKRDPQEEDYAAARFFRPHQRVASDIYAAQEAKRVEGGAAPRVEHATDEQVYERFKKRWVGFEFALRFRQICRNKL